MDVQVYLKKINSNDYQQLDLFDDEKIEINLNVKTINDISKIKSDFTQSFSVPASPNNNKLFQYWFNADVDGLFNANVRVDGYLEVNTIPFKYGSIQLEKCKLKYLNIESYQITFFGLAVNLSDKFGDDLLKSLPLSQHDHNYNQNLILGALNNPNVINNDIYYPFINYRTFMDVGNGLNTDLLLANNSITYKDFKPALREIEIIKAIENKYNVTFSKDFFDRSIFYNKHLALHKESGQMKSNSTSLLIDFDNLQTIKEDWNVANTEVNLINNSVDINVNNFPQFSANRYIRIVLVIYPTSLDSYKVEVFNNNILDSEFNNLNGQSELTIYEKNNIQQNEEVKKLTFKVSSINNSINFNSRLSYNSLYRMGTILISKKRFLFAYSNNQTTQNAMVKISEQMPEIKIKDYFNNLINKFNLVLIPIKVDSYYVDTLDNWYSKGKIYDVNNYIDIKDTEVKKPTLKKLIEFKYQKTESVLGKAYFDNNQKSYGDLKATYNVDGDELKIESTFENILFERMKNETTDILTEINAGYLVNIENKPVKGKSFSIYKNGEETGFTIYINGVAINKLFHTATEDNKILSQVTNSLNFGDENSSYLFSPITTGLYFNFWKTYIEDLYNRKCRVLPVKLKIPLTILFKLNLNDRLIIQDKKYKISNLKVNLTNGEFFGEVYTDFSNPFDSIDNEIPFTVDNTNITVDSENITVDKISSYEPITSYTNNSVSLTEYNCGKSEENFELKIEAKNSWNIICPYWIIPNKNFGNKTDYLRIKIQPNNNAPRTAIIVVNIGNNNFNINVNQL